MKVCVIGLTITSTWGNGHATTYRGLLKALAERGHSVTFLERDVPWYRDNRDEPEPEGVQVRLYGSLQELRDRHAGLVRDADVVVVGSYVPDGIEVARWALATARGTKAFYDIDTPVTLQALSQGTCAYATPELLASFDVVFSFAAGHALTRLEREFGVRRALPLLCAVDAARYVPQVRPVQYDLSYLGTYSDDRQPALERLLCAPARRRPQGRFAVAGPQYPPTLAWPANVELLGNLPQARHVAFYTASRYALNVTRQAMVEHGHSPSVRLFEAAATATPVISDPWPGLEDYFRPGKEILVAHEGEDVLAALDLADDLRAAIGARARERVLREHTAQVRARQFEQALGVTVDA
ncbi:MAG TPA: glycosyltransferase [Candidatus Thermoplasmatota archaeon]|nr:glycosyltransferase [Candidatus Thermoplasmatota archaeon]